VNNDRREEIAASVAAHSELGPRYEAAVAEGLVERIGEEIDRRVEARLREAGQQAVPSRAGAAAADSRPLPAGPLGGPQAPRGVAATAAGVILALGSMGLGVGATAAVAAQAHNAGGTIFFTTVAIWTAIVLVNWMHARGSAAGLRRRGR
jgi:hypothetical protein